MKIITIDINEFEGQALINLIRKATPNLKLGDGKDLVLAEQFLNRIIIKFKEIPDEPIKNEEEPSSIENQPIKNDEVQSE